MRPFFNQIRKIPTNAAFRFSRKNVMNEPRMIMKLHLDEEKIFNMFKDGSTGFLSIRTFLNAMKNTGIRTGDPRFKESLDILHRMQEDHEIDLHKLNLEQFKTIISPNIGLISKALKDELVIPDFQIFCHNLSEMYEICKPNQNGKVADYIPQLKRVDPESWALSVCTVDGQRFSLGDVHVPFTLQSCSKPLTYALALDILGSDMVHQYVGQEPSGRNFNELILNANNKPHNPMINAGSIIVCALLNSLVAPESSHAERFDVTVKYISRLAGNFTIGFNNSVFLSERESADRNFALGYYMKEHKCFPPESAFKDCMDFYFQCCSLESDCKTMAVIASSLANGGICPITGEKVLKPESVRDVLSLMHSCGMYDYSGQFAFNVGLPAKSGVSGSLIIVIPNVMGMSCWSPRLDQLGNSVRGVQFCEEFVKKYNFHHYDNLRHASNKLDPRKHRFETQAEQLVDLLFTTAAGDLIGLRRHKFSGMDMTLQDYDGRTALHVAACEGHVECAKFLLAHGQISHLVKDRWGRTPLDDATIFGHTEIVRLLKEWANK